jgi:hypothetical protein
MFWLVGQSIDEHGASSKKRKTRLFHR